SLVSRTPPLSAIGTGGAVPTPDGRRLVVGHTVPDDLPQDVAPDSWRWDVIERRTGRVLGSATMPNHHGKVDGMSPDSAAHGLLTGEGDVAVLGVGRHPGKLRTLARGTGHDLPDGLHFIGLPSVSFSNDGRRLLVVRTIQGERSARATVFDVATG